MEEKMGNSSGEEIKQAEWISAPRPEKQMPVFGRDLFQEHKPAMAEIAVCGPGGGKYAYPRRNLPGEMGAEGTLERRLREKKQKGSLSLENVNHPSVV